MSFPNSDRVEDINDRMYLRNIPSAPLQAQFDARPVSTKYALLPIVDRRPVSSVPIAKVPLYNQTQIFSPGTTHGPWAGFATNVNDESILRNQFYALQRGAYQGDYVPPSYSDMYINDVPATVGQQPQPYPNLFERPHLEPFNPNPDTAKIGINLFDNCTRQQLKGDEHLATPSALPPKVLKRHQIK
jgi:hypothetical protein